MKRRFQFVSGNSAKFWEIALSTTDVTVRFGRLGTAGQTHIKSFANAASAGRHADKITSDKLRKGYVECAA